MAKKCIQCGSKAYDDFIMIDDDFEGCFCRDCYRKSKKSIDGFLGLIFSLFDAETEEEMNQTYDEIEGYADGMNLCIDGSELLFTYLNEKLPQITGIIDSEEEDVAKAERNERIQERRQEYEAHRHRMRRDFIAVTKQQARRIFLFH